MRAYLFPFLSVKIQSSACFTKVYDRICFLFVHFYEHARQVSAHTRVHAEITRTPFRCGGDECDADSLSLLRQSYAQKYILCVCVCVCVCIYIYISCLFAFLSKPYSCLPNSVTVSPRYRSLRLDNNQLSALPADIFAGLSSLE